MEGTAVNYILRIISVCSLIKYTVFTVLLMPFVV